MKEGDILLTDLPQADGSIKLRPVLYLRTMKPFGDFLVCGVSSQAQQACELDEIIGPQDVDYRTSGLKAASVIRLGYLAVLPRTRFKGRIGGVFRERRTRLVNRLAEYLSRSSP